MGTISASGELLTTKEAATMLRSSRQHVLNLIKGGVLPCVRKGPRSFLVPKEALFQYMNLSPSPTEQTTMVVCSVALPFPPTSNTAYSNNPGRGRHLSPVAKQWKREALFVAKQQLANAYVPHPMEMRIRLWMPDNRPRDIDNYAKLPKDVCCEVLGRNDTWFNIPRLVIECLGVKPNGRCEVCFLALEGDVRFAQARGD